MSTSLKAAITTCLIASTATGQSPTLEGSSIDWQEVRASGLTIYQTGQGSSYLAIACDHSRTIDGSATGITLTLNGEQIPSGTPITFTTERGSVIYPQDGLKSLWKLVRAGRSLEATAAGQSASFSLEGAADLLPLETCKE